MIIRRLGTCLLLVLVLVPAGAARAAAETAPSSAAGWDSTFAPAPLATNMPKERRAYLVVGAGGAAAPAERALRAALRAVPTATLVMDAAALGSVDALDDAAIAGKAKNLPVDVIAIARVFPGGPGEPARVVVTLYDKKGQALGAFTGQQGVQLAAGMGAAPPTAPTEGLQANAAAQVASVLKTERTDHANAQDQYDQKYVGFDDIVVANRYGAVATGVIPYQGKYKRSLQGAEFYRAVDREDLARQYESKHAARMTVVTLSIIGEAVGLGLMLYAIGDTCTDQSGFETPCHSGAMYAGATLASASLIIMFIPLFMKDDPVTPDQARAIADAHNHALKRQLGLEESGAAPRASGRDRARVRWSLAPTVSSQGGGLAFGLQF
jgi:hypothetical protein